MPKNQPARVGNIVPDLKPLTFPVERLRPLPGNPRRGDVESVARSYSRFGQRKPIVARREGEAATVIAGNHQLAAAKKLGWTHLAVVWVDDDEVTAKAFALADNRTSDLGTYDDPDLLAMLQSIERDDPELLAAASYSDGDLAALMASLDAPEGAGTDTDPIAPPAEPVTRRGELILLDEHRLLCGDATSATDAEVLMDGCRSNMMWTDPPYGVSYVGKTKNALRLSNDGHEGLEALLRDAFAVADSVLAPGAAMYIAHPAGQFSVTFGRVFLATGWRLHETLVWVKDTMVLGHSDYHYRHEPMLFGYTQGGGKRGRGAEGWYGDNTQTSVLEFARPKASLEHPTCKPVGLIERCLLNSSPTAAGIYDAFAGSGSTLIACENLGRRCYAMEIEPRYCDVIVDRWERHTGRTAKRG